MTEFVKKVKEMREEQKLYFKTRKKSHLFRSKELEKEVDKMIAEFNFKQINLFENEK